MKAIIFPTEEHAKQADWNSNNLTGSITRKRYARRLLQETTTLTKAEYAALYGIPETLMSEEAIEVPNPRYQALQSSYTLNQCGLCVGDDHDLIDEETGERTVPDYVVDISAMILESGEDV